MITCVTIQNLYEEMQITTITSVSAPRLVGAQVIYTLLYFMLSEIKPPQPADKNINASRNLL